MDIDISDLRGLVREKEISLRPAGRGDRVGPPIRLPPHRGKPPTRAWELNRETGTCDRVGEGGPRGPRGGAGAPRVRRHAVRLRPHRRDHRQAGDPAAAARRRGRRDARRVRRPRGRHLHGRGPAGAATRRTCSWTSASWRPSCRCRSRCPARPTRTACACGRTSSGWPRACAVRPSPLAHAPQSGEEALRPGGAGTPTARSRSPRSRVRPVTARRAAARSTQYGPERQGRLHRPHGRPGAQRDGRTERREDRHRGLVGRPGRDGRQRAVTRSGEQGGGRGGRSARPGDRAGLPVVAGHRQGGPERPPRGPAHRLAGSTSGPTPSRPRTGPGNRSKPHIG